MTDSDGEDALHLPPQAQRALWSEILAHMAAVLVTITAATLLTRNFPGGTDLGPFGASLLAFVLALPAFRSISRHLIFKLPPDKTHWTLHFGLVRWAPREFSDALPAWQIYARTYYGPGVARAIGFGLSVIGCTLAVIVVNGPITLSPWLTIPLLLFACSTVVVNALFHNRLPRKDGTSSLFR
tara:strand:- start:148 stop:696 length:549 start_codon:yes stop_codon:yes gene_type:complete